MSWWEIPFRTVIRQRYDFSCGSAALATLLHYHYGRALGERESFAAMWANGDQDAIRRQGFSLLDMKTYLDKIGYRAEGFRLDLAQLKQVRRPLILLLDLRGFKHFVVLKGMTDDKILVGDPMLGLTQYRWSEFGHYWNGVVLAVMRTPDRRLPSFNLVSDWNFQGGRALDRTIGGRTSIADVTNYLPPAYQLSPVMLLDVRVGTVN
nr:C39 family peptidase [Sphingomonas naasensis]